MISHVLNTVYTLVYIPIIIGASILEIFLSRSKNLWLGLILPVISFTLSIPKVFAVIYIGLKTTAMGAPTVNQVLLNGFVYFMIFNVPTIILLVIFFIMHKIKFKQHELEKMKIQDLE